MGIYKRGDRWWIDFRARGRRYREPAGHHRELAVRLLAKRRAEVEAGMLGPRTEDVTLREWSVTFLEWSDNRKASASRDHTSMAQLLPILGDRFLYELTPDVIERYQRQRLKMTTRFGGPPKPATINREVACLKKALSLAVRDRKIREHPARGVEMLPEHNERSVTVTDEQLAAILELAPDWLRPIAVLARSTAMRRSEIVKLRWDQVDLDAGFIRLMVGETKNRDWRSVPLAPVAIVELKRLPRTAERVFERHPDSISHAFAEACADAGLAGVTFHDLRHTAVTGWADKGFDQALIMKATGHKTASVFRRYRAATEERLRALVVDTPVVTKKPRRSRKGRKTGSRKT